MAAFDAAAEAGYAIELDVHASRDGEVMVFHDSTLDRMTASTGPIAHRTHTELGKIRVGDSQQTIPTLEAVLRRVADRVPVVIEVKNEGEVGPLEPALAAVVRRVPGRYTIQAFNPRPLIWFRRNLPDYPRGLLATDFSAEALPWHEKILLRNLVLAPLVRPAYVGYDLRHLPYWAPTGLRRLGVPLLAWTVRTPQDLARARRLADNVIFENVRP